MADMPSQPGEIREQSVPISVLTSGWNAQYGLDALREHPTFTQAFGARLLHTLLAVVCALVPMFVATWLWTRPTLVEIQTTLGQAEAKVILEAFRELQRDHADQFRSFFQLLVLSGLVPLITLLAGYTFGTHAQEPRSQHNASGSDT